MDEEWNENDEVEQTLKNIIREYVKDEGNVQQLHDKLVDQLHSWNVDVYI